MDTSSSKGANTRATKKQKTKIWKNKLCVRKRQRCLEDGNFKYSTVKQ